MNELLTESEAVLEGVRRLSRDLKKAAASMTDDEARYLVDLYYQMQDNRIRAAGQIRAMGENYEPHSVIAHFQEQAEVLESTVKSALHEYIKPKPIGKWLLAQYGIGPVIAAGLVAHIDIHKAPAVGHIWNYAGLNPGVTWEKGQKRPWNAELKTLCWKIGQSFMKFSNRDQCFYGKLYRERKAFELERNESGKLATNAGAALAKKNYRRETAAKACYEAGKLPPAHIDAMARRWVVKLFLSHMHAVWFEAEFGKKAPEPYAMAHLGHVHKIDPPGPSVAEIA